MGVTAMMIGFPLLMYYLWICLWFYDGQLTHPSSVDDIKPFLGRMWAHVREVHHIWLFTQLRAFDTLKFPGREP